MNKVCYAKSNKYNYELASYYELAKLIAELKAKGYIIRLHFSHS